MTLWQTSLFVTYANTSTLKHNAEVFKNTSTEPQNHTVVCLGYIIQWTDSFTNMGQNSVIISSGFPFCCRDLVLYSLTISCVMCGGHCRMMWGSISESDLLQRTQHLLFHTRYTEGSQLLQTCVHFLDLSKSQPSCHRHGHIVHQQTTRGTRSEEQKDTKAAISDLQMPEVNAQVICRQVGLTVAVDRDGVDVVGVSVGKHSPGAGFHHQVHGPEYWYLRRGAGFRITSFVETTVWLMYSSSISVRL